MSAVKIYSNNDEMIPLKFQLSQNFPNPFSEKTTIRFTIPAGKPQRISLSVIDLSGQTVKTVQKGVFPPGNYTITLKASDYSSGMYYYRLETDSGTQIRKMVIAENQ